MKSFTAWIEALNSNLVNYDDIRYKKSDDSKIELVKESIRPFIDTKNFDIAGHGLRTKEDIPRVFRLGLQAPNNEFGRILFKVLNAGISLDNQPTEAFDTLLQWPFVGRKNIILVALPHANHDSVWRPIRDDEEKSFIPTALGKQIKWTISPEHILGCFDANTIKFIPRF